MSSCGAYKGGAYKKKSVHLSRYIPILVNDDVIKYEKC